MHFLPNERVALFIDGANLYSASRNLGFDVDYRNLLDFFRKKSQVIRAYYYSAVLETDEYSPLKPLTDWLAYNGYTLVTKPAKEFTDSSGRRRVKGSMDIEVAVDMLELAPRLDHAILFSGDSDFRRLVEAIKFVYASTYFREARDYRKSGATATDEKMAVIIQEVVGLRRGERFYPDVSGVARSYNYYAFAPARPEDGVVTLALGLGKTIVDGGLAWTFSPAFPQKPPPFASIDNMLDGTQKDFWAVNMGKPPAYDPVSETEYLVNATLSDAENDGVLDMLASTYDPHRDRVLPGTNSSGPRILNFAPMLMQHQFPVNELVRALLHGSELSVDAKVEIEFAITFEIQRHEISRARLGFLQVRSLVVSDQRVDVSEEQLTDSSAIVASDMVIGNGATNDIQDIVYVRPEAFSPMITPTIAQHLETVNRELQQQHRPFLLIGFGRWGSSHPSLGIPVDWSQISGARTIVEATLPEMNVELSQGSHFFHNLSSFQTNYFMVRHGGPHRINWSWLNQQPVMHETELIRHVRPESSLAVRVDGRTRRGIILSEQNAHMDKRNH